MVRPLLAVVLDLAPTAEPSQVSITFSGLLATQEMTLSFFEDEARGLAQIVDTLKRRTRDGVQLASLLGLEDVPPRIAFGTPDTET